VTRFIRTADRRVDDPVASRWTARETRSGAWAGLH
jgi:hypothetical protein